MDILWGYRIQKGMPRLFWLVTPQNSLHKNSYYHRKVGESLEIDMMVVRYGQEKVLNRNNGNFVKTNAWKPLLRKMKTLHWNLTFCIKWRFCVALSSVWKQLQSAWSKYHDVNNITYVVLLPDFHVQYLIDEDIVLHMIVWRNNIWKIVREE